MIVKKIPARAYDRRAGSGRAKHVRDLLDYMRSPEKKSPLKDYLVAYMADKGRHDGPERLIHIGARNFVCEDIEGRRAEMMAVAQAAVLSENPIDHWLLSWREGEIPINDEVGEAVAIFVEELGVAQNQCIFAVHGDTHNRHVHIALNRFNPATGKIITIDKGFYRRAPHKAVARIVDRFGWQPEVGARYVMAGGKPVLSAAAEAKEADAKQSLRMGAAALEVRTGYRSAQRIAQEDALPLMLKARSWNEFHGSLAKQGIQYDPVGTNGAVLTIAGEKVKASSVSRRATISKLETRLGPFEARESSLVIADQPGLADKFPGAFRAEEFQRERKRWKAADKAERKRLGLKRPASDLETWLHSRNEPWFAERWRNRDLNFDDLTGFVGIAHAPERAPMPVGDYQPYPCAEGVRYAREGEATAFIDRGTSITVMPGGDEALLAAFKLAIERFDGKVRVNADDEIKQRILALAKKHGLAHHLTNPEFRSLEAEAPDRQSSAPESETPVTQRSQAHGGIIAQAAQVVASREAEQASTDVVAQRSGRDEPQRRVRGTPVTQTPPPKGGIIDQAANVSASRRREQDSSQAHVPNAPEASQNENRAPDNQAAKRTSRSRLLQQAKQAREDMLARTSGAAPHRPAGEAPGTTERDRHAGAGAVRKLARGPSKPEMPLPDPRTRSWER